MRVAMAVAQDDYWNTVFARDVHCLDCGIEAIFDIRRCNHYPGESPWPPKTAMFRSDCSTLVGIPVEGPPR